MLPRYALVAAALALAALLIWHPAQRPVVAQAAATSQPPLELGADSGDGSAGRLRHRRVRLDPGDGELVVYVAGAVKRPGLYHLRAGDRDAQAVAVAGGLSAAADAGAVNLAQRANDGDEIYVPVAGEPTRARSSERHGRRRPAHPPPAGGVDVNRSDAAELAAVPGIGRAIAARIVELREREGSFASLDELLDVAGMTQTRLERARSYLRQP
jgi:competence protein ComEA